jgi:hypothetical protein
MLLSLPPIFFSSVAPVLARLRVFWLSATPCSVQFARMT